MDATDRALALLEADQHTECFQVMQAEIDRLSVEVKSAQAVCDSYAKENQQFHDEIERLRAALAQIADSDCHYDPAATLMRIARDVLANEQKP